MKNLKNTEINIQDVLDYIDKYLHFYVYDDISILTEKVKHLKGYCAIYYNGEYFWWGEKYKYKRKTSGLIRLNTKNENVKKFYEIIIKEFPPTKKYQKSWYKQTAKTILYYQKQKKELEKNINRINKIIKGKK